MASSMTKSALTLAWLSLQIAQASRPAYAHKFSPKHYTQPQLFSILVLRPFFKTDYRGIVVLLAEWAELRSTLGLKHVPNYSTLCYAERRLCTQPVLTCSSRSSSRRKRNRSFENPPISRSMPPAWKPTMRRAST